MNSNRVYYTPRVEIGSEQYWDDVALMQSFYSYEDYLNYMKDDLDVEDFHDKDRSRASRRKITARRHKRSVRNSKILNHKGTKKEPDKACYKRARILQPQCVELEDIMPKDPIDYTDLVRSFDTSSEFCTYWLDFSKMFPTYGDYLYSIAKRYVEHYSSTTTCGYEVIGLRISEHTTSNYHRSITAKANAHEKRTSCLSGSKKKKAQAKQEELKAKKAAEAAKIAENKKDKKSAWVAGFTTFNGKVLDYSNEQSDSDEVSSSDEESIINVHGSYCNPRHRSSSHPVIVPRFATKETKVPIKMVRSTFIPIFF